MINHSMIIWSYRFHWMRSSMPLSAFVVQQGWKRFWIEFPIVCKMRDSQLTIRGQSRKEVGMTRALFRIALYTLGNDFGMETIRLAVIRVTLCKIESGLTNGYNTLSMHETNTLSQIERSQIKIPIFQYFQIFVIHLVFRDKINT